MIIKHKAQQLYDILAEQLHAGVYPNGHKLPALRELAKQYGVSINVVAKTVEMLKDAGLVRAKASDGIYSLGTASGEALTAKFAGGRIFGQYAWAKVLRVIVEDNEEWQQEFWSRFFKKFSAASPDIEILVHYRGSRDAVEEYDMGFGCAQFLTKCHLEPGMVYPASLYREFYPELYRDKLLTPEMLAWRGDSCYLPYGFMAHFVMCRKDTPEPRTDESVLNYLDRLATMPGKTVNYQIFDGMSFLRNEGMNFFSSETGTLVLPERKQMLDIFRRAREHYAAKRLTWLHGNYPNYQEPLPETAGQMQLVEIPLQGRRKFTGTASSPLILSVPGGSRLCFTPVMAAIGRKCTYPEEALRLVKELLSGAEQERMQSSHVAQSLRADILHTHGDGEHADMLARGEGRALFIPDRQLLELYCYVVNWEFYYYLNGQRDDRVYEFIQCKLKYGKNRVPRDDIPEGEVGSWRNFLQ